MDRFRRILLVFFFIAFSSLLHAESVNEIFIRIKYNSLYSYDNKDKPSKLETEAYINELITITNNYCDSTTISYHPDLVQRIYDIYPYIEQNIPILNDINSEILMGLINIYFSEEFSFNGDRDIIIKFHHLVFQLTTRLYVYMDEANQTFFANLLISSYIDDELRIYIVNNWLKEIENINSAEDYIQISDLFHCLSHNLSSNGEHKNALKIENALLQKCMIFFEKTSDAYLICLSYQSNVLFNDGHYAEAIFLLNNIIDTKKAQGVSDNEIIIALRNIRDVLFDAGRYSDAMIYAERILATYSGNNSNEYLLDLENAVSCWFYTGKEDEAINAELQIINHYQDSNKEELLRSYTNLSTFYHLQTDIVNAIKYGWLAVSLYEQAPSDNYNKLFYYYYSLVRLADIYYSLWDIQSSIKVLKKAMVIHNRLKNELKFDKDRLKFDIIFWAVLAKIYIITNHPTEAKKTLDIVLPLARNFYGESNSRFLKIYAISADLEFIKGDIKSVLNIYSHMLSMMNHNSMEYFRCLGFYSETLYAMGLFNDARDTITKAYSITNSTDDLIQYSRCEYRLGNYNSVHSMLHEISKRRREEIIKSFSTFNFTLQSRYWVKIGDWFQTELPSMVFSLFNINSEGVSTLFDATIFSKGILLNSEIEFSKLIAESGDEEIMSLYSELQSNRRLLNRLYEKPIAERFVDTDSIESKCESLERELIQKSKVYGDFTHNMSIDWKQVQSKLNDDDIAIEFISFPTENDSVMYCALTLKKRYDVPQMIPLFEKKQLTSIDKEDYYISSAISELVWRPLKEELDSVKNVYFAPAGELYNIAIESLRDFDGDGYVFDNRNFYRLSSTRELAIVKDKSNTDNVALYGGLIYDPDKVTFEKDTTSQNNYYAHTRSLPDSIGLRAGYDYLRGTLIEVEKIDSLYTNKHTPTTLFTDVVGTETSIKKLSGKKLSNLHISTHGFYWSESKVETDKDLQNLRFLHQENNPRYIEDKAMTRSGLLFAGANAILQGDSIPDNCDDGILTAQEIATLDFRGLDLLVLSACQTGLGELKGDGVFGLQRGFKKAGVQTIVMSLWKVDDDATQMLMTSFYENLLAGKSKRESFFQAQKAVRETRGWEDPEYWAGFILLDALN